MVVFAPQNLAKDPPFTRIDLLCCRNLLIYLQPSLQRKLISLFSFSLRQGGILFLGSSETLGDFSDQFTVINAKWRLFANRSGRSSILNETLQIPQRQEQPSQPELHSLGDNRQRNLEPIVETLLHTFLPPGVVVDPEYNILHVLGNVQAFVGLQPGKPSFRISTTVRKELLVPVETALHQARQTGREVIYRQVPYQPQDSGDIAEQAHIDLYVRPLYIQQNNPLYAVLFQTEIRPQPEHGATEINVEESAQQRIEDLEKELQYTRENLQATIEELETSNEELQATNEELIASNEELQSTNEELQSVNEELHTVNSEYQQKIRELTELNNDMDNLLASTEIGTIFLDDNLCIRRFTAAATQYLHIMDRDLGRPLAHFSHNLGDADLVKDAQQVSQQRAPLERRIETDAGRWVLIMTHPYKTDDPPQKKGCVITFIDVTTLKHTQDALMEQRERFNRLLKTTPSAVMVLDAQGNFTFVNERTCELFGLTEEDITHRRFDASQWQPRHADGTPFASDELPFAQVMATGEQLMGVHQIVRHHDGTNMHLRVNAGPLRDDNGHIEGVLVVLNDITQEIAAQKRLHHRGEVFQNLPFASFLLDDNGIMHDWNQQAEDEGWQPAVDKNLTDCITLDVTADQWQKLLTAPQGGCAPLAVHNGQQPGHLQIKPLDTDAHKCLALVIFNAFSKSVQLDG